MYAPKGKKKKKDASMTGVKALFHGRWHCGKTRCRGGLTHSTALKLPEAG